MWKFVIRCILIYLNVVGECGRVKYCMSYNARITSSHSLCSIHKKREVENDYDWLRERRTHKGIRVWGWYNRCCWRKHANICDMLVDTISVSLIMKKLRGKKLSRFLTHCLHDNMGLIWPLFWVLWVADWVCLWGLI